MKGQQAHLRSIQSLCTASLTSCVWTHNFTGINYNASVIKFKILCAAVVVLFGLKYASQGLGIRTGN